MRRRHALAGLAAFQQRDSGESFVSVVVDQHNFGSGRRV